MITSAWFNQQAVMLRKFIDKRFTDYPDAKEKGVTSPFPALRRGRVWAEPGNGSMDWSLAGS
ncbi:hypothetical protein D5281_06845 [bacterium 1xD42-62]|uniref:Uncharacterized protein n=1 Tax=Parablautia muri TaxID=2320879 RepID=A0A9X5GRR1_9FIRM|nr:hypothetical protein [Parablautia muri]